MRVRLLRCSVPLVAAGLAVWTLTAVPARACTIDCNPPTACTCSGSGTCTITTVQAEAPGAVVDCSGRDIVLAGGSIQVTNGVVTVRANNLTVNQQSSLKALRSGGSTAPYGLRLELTGMLDLNGLIEAKGDGGGGSITVDTAGTVNVQGGGQPAFNANGTSADAPGGSVQVTSGGQIALSEAISATAGDTGTAVGGHVVLTAASGITVAGLIDVLGRKAQGGRIVLKTPGLLWVQDPLKAEGYGVDGDGGQILLTGGTVSLNSLVTAQGGVGALGGQSQGGSVHIEAGAGGVALNADIDVTGGAQGAGHDGGAIVVEVDSGDAATPGAITVANGATLLTRSQNLGGDGGDIVFESDGGIVIDAATLDARGHSAGGNQGTGATISLSACNVTLNPSATIDASGYHGGAITLTGHETLKVSLQSLVKADWLSGGTPGTIVVETRVDGKCSDDPARGCPPSQCTGGTCTHDPAIACATTNDCTECPTGSCVAPNPDLGNPITQFIPFPELSEDRNLGSCQ
jgi:hypothetical protein